MKEREQLTIDILSYYHTLLVYSEYLTKHMLIVDREGIEGMNLNLLSGFTGIKNC
jgi:hypothetical protein